MIKSITQMRFALLLFFVGISIELSVAQITTKKVDPVNNPLADSLVRPLVGRGVIVQNIKSNIRETGNAIGTIKDQTGLLGIRRGLLLTTSRVDSVPRPNGPTFTGPPDNPSPGNILSVTIPGTDTLAGASTGRSILNQVLNVPPTPRRTFDVATVEFEVIAATDSLEFRYMFFSEEYPTFVCSGFNDIFGFFITGPGIQADPQLATLYPNTKNIALLPDTNIPVAINTVNNGIPGTSGTASNCQFSPQGIAAYRSNQSPASPLWNLFKFDGLTVVLTAKIKVQPCQVYRLILTVADVGDNSFDSGVIIEAGSLKGTGVVTVANSVFGARFPYMIVGCNDGKFLFKRCGLFLEDSIVVRWQQQGTAVNGQDFMQLLPDNTLQVLPDSFVLKAGKDIDSIMIRGLDNPTWNGVPQKNIILRYLDQRTPYNPDGSPNFAGEASTLLIRRRFIYDTGPDSIRICPNQDTTVKPVSVPYPGDRYLWREIRAGDTLAPVGLSCDNCIRPIINIDTTRRYVVYVKDSASGCVATDTITIRVFPIPTAEITSSEPNFTVCEGRSITIFANPPTADPTWRYSWSLPTPPNQIGGATNTISFNMFRTFVNDTLKLRITNLLGCSFDTVVTIRVAKNPKFDMPPLDTVCGYVPLTIEPINMQDTIGGQYFWTIQGSATPIGNAPTLTYTPTSSVTLVLSVANSCTGIQGALTKTIKVNVKDSVRFDFVRTLPVCEDDTTLLIAPKALRDSVRFVGWYDNVDGNLVLADSISKSVLPATTTFYAKQVDRCYTYWQPIQAPVVNKETPLINIVYPADTILPINLTFKLDNQANTFLNYDWKLLYTERGVNENIANSNEPAFSSILREPGSYRVDVAAIKRGIFGIDTIGCVNLATKEFTLKGELIIPSLITRNGDGKNDKFSIRNFRRGLQLTIINRWGKEIYKSNGDYTNDFEPGDDMRGIHYYLIRDRFTGKVYRGWVEIVQAN